MSSMAESGTIADIRASVRQITQQSLVEVQVFESASLKMSSACLQPDPIIAFIFCCSVAMDLWVFFSYR